MVMAAVPVPVNRFFKYFIEKDDDGVTVNRLEAIGHLGGSQQNSEEEYLILKFMRGLGVVAVDNQARV